jgi:hypothetical protein
MFLLIGTIKEEFLPTHLEYRPKILAREVSCGGSNRIRGCTGEFSRVKGKKILVPRMQEKKKPKRRPKSPISAFDNGGQYQYLPVVFIP